MQDATKYRQPARSRAVVPSVVLATVLVVLAIAGCGRTPVTPVAPPADRPATPSGEAPAVIDPTMAVTLYFSDAQAMGVVAERRHLAAVPPSELPKALVSALVQGPRTAYLRPAIPAGATLRAVTVQRGTAYVDFAADLQHSGGGSAMEMILARSVVYTLTELPGIEQVQFLVEGRPPETLLGHLSADRPIRRHVATGPVYVDPDRVNDLQRQADAGAAPWLLDPLAAARREGRAQGFTTSEMALVSAGGTAGPTATVRARQGQWTYRIELVQPGRAGPGGIWLIAQVEMDVDTISMGHLP